LPTAKVTSIQTLDGIFTTRYPLEFEIDVALGVGIEGDVDNMSIFAFAFGADVVFEFFDPGVAFFPISPLVFCCPKYVK
jgi:hypothetical protein